MWNYIVPALSAIIVAVIEAIAARERRNAKKHKEKEAKWIERRAEESRLSMQMASATLQLSIVNANALTGGHNNGNVEVARQAAKKAQEEYTEFLQKIAADELAKK